MSSNHVCEYTSRDPTAEDGLFLERLETFMDKCLADIRAFSERELRPFEQTRRSVAEWHSKYLFQSSVSSTSGESVPDNRRDYVRSALMDTSRILESLAETAGVQSFFLSVDPGDDEDPGFLGGSLYGREFWRNLRGGGDHGAKAFKRHCLKYEAEPRPPAAGAINILPQAAKSKTQASSSSTKVDAKSVKSDLYETVRKALKLASGVRNAEMKWTNPERLDMYGVRLVGWPPDIPPQNPSTLKVNQNKQLLEAFKSGAARFERLPGSLQNIPAPALEVEVDSADNDDFSWAYDPDASPKISYRVPAPAPAVSTGAFAGLSSPRHVPSNPSTRENTPLSSLLGSSLECLDVYASSSTIPREHSSSDNQADDIVRPRKRPRSGDESSRPP